MQFFSCCCKCFNKSNDMVKVNPGTNCPDRVWSFVSKELEVLTIPYENPTERPACSVRIGMV